MSTTGSEALLGVNKWTNHFSVTSCHLSESWCSPCVTPADKAAFLKLQLAFSAAVIPVYFWFQLCSSISWCPRQSLYYQQSWKEDQENAKKKGINDMSQIYFFCTFKTTVNKVDNKNHAQNRKMYCASMVSYLEQKYFYS